MVSRGLLIFVVPALLLGAVAAAQQTQQRALARGAAVFDYWCATCHSAGPGMPGTAALEVKYGGSPPALLLERSDLTPALIAFYVRNGISVMPPFRKTEIGDEDLEALAAYILTQAAD